MLLPFFVRIFVVAAEIALVEAGHRKNKEQGENQGLKKNTQGEIPQRAGLEQDVVLVPDRVLLEEKTEDEKIEEETKDDKAEKLEEGDVDGETGPGGHVVGWSKFCVRRGYEFTDVGRSKRRNDTENLWIWIVDTGPEVDYDLSTPQANQKITDLHIGECIDNGS